MADVIRSILLGIAAFFINPVFYLLVVGLFLFSAQRVRRERRSFRVKAYGMFNTIFRSIAPSLIIGAAGSALLLISGTALPAGTIVLISCAYLAIMLTTQLRFLSPAIAGGLSLIVVYFMPDVHTSYPLVNQWIAGIRHTSFLSLGVFIAVGMLAESVLVYLWGANQPSPRLINSRRGGMVGAQEASELWIIPLFFLVPLSGPIGHIGFWPLIPGTRNSFGLALFPLGVGMAQLITYSLPKEAVRKTGHWLLITAGGFAVFIALAAVLRMPLFAVTGGALALVSRLALIWHQHVLRENKPFYYIRPNKGIRVIGVIPHSLGAKMGILPGEEIMRVNDIDVVSEYDFYQALQKHVAYCKLEVIDRFGEPRFAKGPVHEEDGHKIGLLFLESDQWNGNLKTKS
ncbi:cell division protein [Sporolactobacillus shoreae]|uniref:Cell division protein n=1 Tax=Sporolactobacillus shoreae TaxID=1465501 RepID=A0A4Z0GNG6_9BACL|nr:cell division protein [Sporolactobacillus shoreae]TGA97390.1 cell division protein [Sporolactobacillus shoreae]